MDKNRNAHVDPELNNPSPNTPLIEEPPAPPPVHTIPQAGGPHNPDVDPGDHFNVSPTPEAIEKAKEKQKEIDAKNKADAEKRDQEQQAAAQAAEKAADDARKAREDQAKQVRH